MYIKNYSINILKTLILIIISSLILNILNYFDLLNTSIYKGLLVSFMIISVFISSLKLGNKTEKNGYLNGIIFGVIIVIILLLITLITKEKISISSIIYYLIILITSIIGSTIGINKKRTNT